MSWLIFESVAPALPAHCTPENDFLYHFSSTFHTCVPTNLAFLSTALGCLSLLSWLFAQLPQIYKNYTIKSTSGLSIFFLVEWCLGDLTNLLGAIFTHQASWQILVAGYYCFVDSVLVIQWVWYEYLKHGHIIRRVWPSKRGNGGRDDAMQQVIIEGMPALSRESSTTSESQRQGSKSKAQDIKGGSQLARAPVWNMPNFLETPKHSDEKSFNESSPGRSIYRTQPGSSFPSPSPRTVLMIACLISLAQASPMHVHPTRIIAPDDAPTPLETAGTVLSWFSTLLYLFSRLPQIYKNWQRQSTSGLSAGLFMAAFFGNLFYSTSIVTNPNAWSSCGPYGNNGWASSEGNDRGQWIINALPFWLGAAGVLGLDATVGLQFWMYGESEDAKVVVLEGDSGSGRWRWRRVSGWMRGWVPTFAEPKRKGRSDEERRALLAAERRGNASYGTNAGNDA